MLRRLRPLAAFRMSSAKTDPRVYFAAERTLLAWVRTGTTVIGLGFIIARFGLYLEEMGGAQSEYQQLAAAELGSALALVGAVVTALATIQFAAFVRHLDSSELPRPRMSKIMSVALSTLVSLVGFVLSGYLVW